ncbi:MAG: pentapeptide repeat-containing protein [Bacilli bacterium]
MKKSIQVQFPKLPKVLDEEVTIYTPIEDGDRFDRGNVRNKTFFEERARRVVSNEVVFEHCNFADVEFVQSEWIDVVFSHCDLSNCNLSSSIFHRVSFQNCKMLGTNFEQSKWTHVTIKNSIMDYANMYLGKLKHVWLEGTSAQHCDFENNDWDNVNFVEMNINESKLLETDLKDIDLSDCTFDSIAVTPEKLAGCHIAQHQAVGFVEALGLIVK